ncbi:MAG: hypothetical protein HOV81_36250 [Kofleriaceae bacterium]|nr:hypothetical protein [Kofleriaceae bacterium]
MEVDVVIETVGRLTAMTVGAGRERELRHASASSVRDMASSAVFFVAVASTSHDMTAH